MRYLTCLFLAICATTIVSNAADPPNLSPAEQQVVDVIKARMDAAARRDLTVWSRYVAEDCIFSGDGGIGTRAEMIAYYTKVPAEYDHATDPRDFVVHLYSDVAVVNLRATDHEHYGANDIAGEQRRNETFVKRGGSWLAVVIQWSANNPPINYRKPVLVNGKLFQDYVGQYQARPKDDVETISIKDGKLWFEVGSEGDWPQAAGGDTFFYTSDLGSFTFTRDAQGSVTGYVNRLPNGREIYNKKIK